MKTNPLRVLVGLLTLATVHHVGLVGALGCAACFGKSDSALAEGMNWGIMTLLVILAGVLGSFLSFVVYLARRSHLGEAAPGSANPTANAKPTAGDDVP